MVPLEHEREGLHTGARRALKAPSRLPCVEAKNVKQHQFLLPCVFLAPFFGSELDPRSPSAVAL